MCIPRWALADTAASRRFELSACVYLTGLRSLIQPPAGVFLAGRSLLQPPAGLVLGWRCALRWLCLALGATLNGLRAYCRYFGYRTSLHAGLLASFM
jgi:hypothetical protein